MAMAKNRGRKERAVTARARIAREPTTDGKFTMDTARPGARVLLPTGPRAPLSTAGAGAHHVMRVLRSPDGACACSTGKAAMDRERSKHLQGRRLGAGDAAGGVEQGSGVLAQGISSRERMDFTIQKAVELGVAEVFPLATRRSLVKLRDDRASRRVDHWQNLAIAACEQCGRNRVPAIHPIMDLADWLGTLARGGTEARAMLSPAARIGLRELGVPSAVLLLVGPEGARSRSGRLLRPATFAQCGWGRAFCHRDRRTRRRICHARLVGDFWPEARRTESRHSGARKGRTRIRFIGSFRSVTRGPGMTSEFVIITGMAASLILLGFATALTGIKHGHPWQYLHRYRRGVGPGRGNRGMIAAGGGATR
jgi:16S rRNA (uracil1498-N3)-methyltransferase